MQQALARQPHVVLLRHAVLAAQVAAIGHRDAQAAQRPFEPIESSMGSLKYDIVCYPSCRTSMTVDTAPPAGFAGLAAVERHEFNPTRRLIRKESS